MAKKVTTILNVPRQKVEIDQNFDNSKPNIRVLVKKRNSDEEVLLINPHKKLIYLDSKVENTELTMLIDIGATNSFMSPRCTERLALIQESIKEVEVFFTKGGEISRSVTKGVKFQVGTERFQEDFIIC